MWTILVILWLIAPPVLLPVAVSAINKKKKLEEFLNELHRAGRISNVEYMSRVADRKGMPQNSAYGRGVPPVQPYYGTPPQTAQPAPIQSVQPTQAAQPAPVQGVQPIQTAQTAPAQSVQPTQAAQPAPAQSVQPAQQASAQRVYPYPPQQAWRQPNAAWQNAPRPQTAPVPPKPKRERNPASVMLVIGSALVVLAGMVFSVANWISMNEWQRTGVIALTSAFFFIVSAIAGKKLKLVNTSMAFYLLGSVFTSITFVTMGWFGLLGESLSHNGSCFWLLYSGAALLVTLFSAAAVKLYKRGVFIHAALYGGLCSFTLMSVQLFDGSPDLWGMFLNIVAALPIFMLYRQKAKGGKDNGDPFRIFTVILASIYGISAVPFMVSHIWGEWTPACFVTLAVWTAQVIAYSILLKNKPLAAVHPFMLLFGFAELAASSGSLGLSQRVILFGCLTAAAAAVYRYVKPIRTFISDLLFPTALCLTLFAGDWDSFTMNAALMTAVIAMHALVKNKNDAARAFTTLLPFAVSVLMFGLTTLAEDTLGFKDHECVLLFAGLIFLTAMVFTAAKSVRTLVSDALFPAVLMVCTFGTIGMTERDETLAIFPFCISLLFTANVAVHAFEDPKKRMVRHFAYILPFTLPVTAFTAADLAGTELGLYDCERFAAFVGVMFLFGLAMRYIPRIRTEVSDWLILSVTAVASAGCFFCCNIAEEYLIAAGTAAVCLTLAALHTFERDPLRDTRPFAYTMPFGTAGMALCIAMAVERMTMPDFAAPLCFAGIIFAAAFVFRFVKRLHTGVSDIVLPMAIIGAGFCLPFEDMWGTLIFVMMAAVMLLDMAGKNAIPLTADANRVFLFVPVLFTSMHIAWGIRITSQPETDFRALFTGIALTAFAFLFRYSGHFLKKLKIRTLVSDIAFTGAGVILAASAYDDRSGFGLILAVLTSGLVFTYVMERKPAHRNFVLISRWAFPCLLMTSAVFAGSTIEDIDINSAALERTGAGVMVGLFAVIALCFRNIRKLRTVFSDFAIPAVLGLICVRLADHAGLFPNGDLAAAAFVILAAMLMMYGFEKEGGSHLIAHRLAAPVVLLAAAYPLSCQIETETMTFAVEKLSYIIMTSVIIIGAGVFTYLEKNPEHSLHREIVHSEYAWSAVAGAGLFFTVQSIGTSPAAQILSWTAFGLCAVLYLICGSQKKNLAGLLPVIAIYPAAAETARQIAGMYALNSYTFYMIMSGAVTAVLFGMSKPVDRESAFVKENDRLRIDFAAFAMIPAPFVAILSGDSAGLTRWGFFTATLEAGLFFLNLIRRGHSRDVNRVMLTLAAAAGCSLIYSRPFLPIADVVVAVKIDLLPLILFSVLIRLIWRDKKKLAADLSFAVQLTAFGILLIDALIHQSLANTIIVLCATLAIMLTSFAVKSGRWFAISAASFAGLTIYITHGFVGRVEWWVYLLTAGLILIAVAAANEYLKSRGGSLKGEGKKFLRRWKRAEVTENDTNTDINITNTRN